MSADSVACAAPVVPPARPRQRQFRAYNVGLAKTGTRSMAGIFAAYRSLHELLFRQTVQAVADRERGAMSEEAFRAFIRWRDELTRLDMDSSSFNCYYVDVLAQEFADALFVFVIRDCFSWLDSLLNMVLFIGPMMDRWMIEYVKRFLGSGFHPDFVDHPARLHTRLPGMVDAGLDYWATMNRRVLAALPGDRSLILHTAELSESLPRLAAFVGVPVETLMPSMSFLHTAAMKYHLLRSLDPAVLAYAYERHCADLMHEFFPTLTLAGYLRRNRHG